MRQRVRAAVPRSCDRVPDLACRVRTARGMPAEKSASQRRRDGRTMDGASYGARLADEVFAARDRDDVAQPLELHLEHAPAEGRQAIVAAAFVVGVGAAFG